MEHENQDGISERCIRNNECKLDAKGRSAQDLDHYNHPLNIEFSFFVLVKTQC